MKRAFWHSLRQKISLSLAIDSMRAAFLKRRRVQLVTVLALVAAPVSVYAWQNVGALSAADNDDPGNQTKLSLSSQAADNSKTSGQSSVSHTSVSVKANSSGGGQSNVAPDATQPGGAGSNTKVTINGQEVPLPPNGVIEKNIVSPDGNASVSVSVNGNSSTSNSSSSSVDLQISNQSDSVSSSSGSLP